MNDINPCDGGSCPHRNTCLRHALKAAARCEDLMDPPFYFTSDGWVCPDYIDNTPEAA